MALGDAVAVGDGAGSVGVEVELAPPEEDPHAARASARTATGRRATHQAGGGRCPGSLTTVTKNSSIWRTTSMKRLKSTGLVTYAFACRS